MSLIQIRVCEFCGLRTDSPEDDHWITFTGNLWFGHQRIIRGILDSCDFCSSGCLLNFFIKESKRSQNAEQETRSDQAK